MKFVSVFALTMTAAAAFQQVQPASRTSALFITKEEDLELTRKVISDFEKGASGDKEEEAAPEPKKEKKVAAAKEE